MICYEKYKPSGVEWIGEVPEHWITLRIKQLAIGSNTLFQDGDWIESKDIVFDEENIRYITTGNVGEGKYKEQGNSFITEETFNKLCCTEVFSGDLLISRLNPPIGRACIIPDLGKRIVTSVDNVILRPNQKYYKNFLVHLFTNPKYYEFTLLEGRGATMQRISRGILGNIKIVLPPSIEEQTAIANYLDDKTAHIDKLIANKQKLIELLKEERTAVINKTVNGEGEHWERKKLKYVAKKVQTGSTPPSTEERYYVEEINWFTPSDFSDNLLLKNSKRKISQTAISDGVVKLFPANSVLFVGIGATLGKVGYINEPAASNQQINCLSFASEDEAFFYANYFYSNQPNIVALANAATLAILNQSQMKDIIVPIPINKADLQDCISKIKTETSRINATIEKIEKEIELIEEYKASLISEVVTGKHKVIN
ncbi:MAG: restriction endonuclease subunit S [Bacteroidetes bacterium]|nr:restriction endonuclease subunit S [Bacteroidota bacterium]